MKRLIRKIADLITDLINKNNDGHMLSDDEQKHDESSMKKLLQLITNITENENKSDKELNGMEQDIGDFGGGSE